MTKQNNVNIRLELIRDELSGSLTILAYFDLKAPNVFLDKNEYIWMPTLEEKDLLNDAFNFFSNRSTLKQVETKETKIKAYLAEKIPPEEPLYEKIPQKYTKSEEKTEEYEEPAIYEATEEKILSEDDDAEQKKEEQMNAKFDVKSREPEKERQTEQKKYGEEIIFKADGEAIGASLKKHKRKDDEDSNLVEVDEQTIVDKVLSQKKKGKWLIK